MFLEFWQLLLLIILSAAWAEYRAYIAYKKGISIGMNTLAKVAVEEMDKIEEDLKYQGNFSMIQYLTKRKIIEVDNVNGIIRGLNGNTIDLEQELNKLGLDNTEGK